MADRDDRLRVAFDPLKQPLAGRYRIERELGRGGMATVYLAEDVRHHRKVAVKVFDAEVSSALGPERFAREIAMVARLNHPHILSLHDSGEADGLLFYVMPYVRGQSLRQALETQKPFPIDLTLRVAQQVASALDHAHAHGLVHRDIKPENILLHEGEAMLMDFGIARELRELADESDQSLTRSGLIVGTPAYMSPEQAVGEPGLDARSDVYSLATVLYEMLAGERPFRAPTFAALVSQRLTDTAPSVRAARIDVPPAVDLAVRKAMARAPVDRFPSAGAFAAALTAAPETPGSRVVAVLPFVNFSANPDNEYFADGITEDVIAQLSKMRSLKVISRTSVMPFKNREPGLREIASRLNASVLLDGSVRRAGDRVRIVAQLIDADTDQHLWGETYDRDLTDIFAIQSDVALHIASALDAALSPEERTRIHREPTTSMEAYQFYLHGRHCLVRYTEEGMRKAIEYFERAIERDANYALAHASIAYAHEELVNIGIDQPEISFRAAQAAVDRALAIDSELAEAHTMLAQLRMTRDFDWAGAEIEFRHAVALSPGSADTHDLYGRMCAALGRFDEAVEMGRRAYDLDPLAHRSDIATTLIRAGRFEEALAAATRALDLDPHYDRAHATLGWAQFFAGRKDEGLTSLKTAVRLSEGKTIWLAQLSQALAMAARMDEAREILDQLVEISRDRYVSPYHLAYVYTGVGEHERALDHLERAYELRAGAISAINSSFLFTPLRSHPRFLTLLRKMNLA
jgi:serine/threonine protein kinase/tetratricopeptide (TPR) repeat protein